MLKINIPQLENSDKNAQTFQYLDWIAENKAYVLGESVLDMGTGHGKFAIHMRNKGFKVTAVDGRSTRIPFNEKNIRWVVMDIMDFSLIGYDTVLFCGLLYHLTLKQQLEILKQIDCKTLIINTHFAELQGDKILNEFQKDKLSMPNSGHGSKYKGLIYKECDDLDELESRPLAALNEKEAFWPTLESLEDMVRSVGFTSFEVLTPYIFENRTFIICTR